jgi:hypothetical protein
VRNDQLAKFGEAEGYGASSVTLSSEVATDSFLAVKRNEKGN